ncbi:hypothetical protein [Streptomyces sp. NPDC051218]|uniref:hypothetical protein n=1 Tax=Streptomyces sp. NPDC051218 TaxID=3365645 RepID=UPI0037B2FFCF
MAFIWDEERKKLWASGSTKGLDKADGKGAVLGITYSGKPKTPKFGKKSAKYVMPTTGKELGDIGWGEGNASNGVAYYDSPHELSPIPDGFRDGGTMAITTDLSIYEFNPDAAGEKFTSPRRPIPGTAEWNHDKHPLNELKGLSIRSDGAAAYARGATFVKNERTCNTYSAAYIDFFIEGKHDELQLAQCNNPNAKPADADKKYTAGSIYKVRWVAATPGSRP